MFQNEDKHQMAMEFISLCDAYDGMDEIPEIQKMKAGLEKDAEEKTGGWAKAAEISQRYGKPVPSPDEIFKAAKAQLLMAKLMPEAVNNPVELAFAAASFLEMYEDKDRILKEWIDPGQTN